MRLKLQLMLIAMCTIGLWVQPQRAAARVGHAGVKNATQPRVGRTHGRTRPGRRMIVRRVRVRSWGATRRRVTRRSPDKTRGYRSESRSRNRGEVRKSDPDRKRQGKAKASDDETVESGFGPGGFGPGGFGPGAGRGAQQLRARMRQQAAAAVKLRNQRLRQYFDQQRDQPVGPRRTGRANATAQRIDPDLLRQAMALIGRRPASTPRGGQDRPRTDPPAAE